MMMMKWEKETWKIEWRKDGGKKEKMPGSQPLAPSSIFLFAHGSVANPVATWTQMLPKNNDHEKQP